MSTSFADRKLAYRKFLKSDKWQDFRLRRLVKSRGLCWGCNKESWNHDIHHMIYRKWSDVRMKDCIVLCRDCHCMIHAILEEHPEIKDIEPAGKKMNKIRHYFDVIKSRMASLDLSAPLEKICYRVYRFDCSRFGVPLGPFPRIETLVAFYSHHGPHNRETLSAFRASATPQTHRFHKSREERKAIKLAAMNKGVDGDSGGGT